MATATIPDAVQYLRAGQVTPLAKPTGGHRQLLMMYFLRRLAFKAVIAAKKTSFTDAAGPLQHGVGCQDGANKMIKSTLYFAGAVQTRVLVVLDLKAAFQNDSRRSMLHSLGKHDPDLATVFSRWYTGTTIHRMHHDGSYAHIQASSGIDQGCPLSPCGFAAAVDPISQYILTQTQQTLDSGARLWTYQDDWYIWIKPTHSSRHKPGSERHPHHQPRAAAHQDPDLESLVHQPHPAGLPGQSQVNTEVPRRAPPYHRRQRRKPSGTGWTNIHEHRHAALRNISTIMRDLNQAGLKC